LPHTIQNLTSDLLAPELILELMSPRWRPFFWQGRVRKAALFRAPKGSLTTFQTDVSLSNFLTKPGSIVGEASKSGEVLRLYLKTPVQGK